MRLNRFLGLACLVFLPIAGGAEVPSLIAPGEVLFYRNFGKPEAAAGHVQLDRALRLGSAAYAMPPTPAWKAILAAIDAPSKDNPLPVIFAGELLFPDGKTRKVVAQLELVLKGDGFSGGPGPLIQCNLYTLDLSDKAKPALLWKGHDTLGTLQSSKVHAGTLAAGAKNAFLVKVEMDKVAAEYRERTYRFSTGEDSKVTMEELKASR